MVANTLKEWKLACPHGEFVFPTGAGTIETHSNIVKRGLTPVQVAAGVIDGKGRAKYTGLHSLRHFYASWCINRKADGGLELPLKTIQARLGHSTLAMTADTYGHSPYAKANFVDHSVTDFSSILRFIEDNWSLGHIGNGSFDALAGSLQDMFDFSDAKNSKLCLDPSTGEPTEVTRKYRASVKGAQANYKFRSIVDPALSIAFAVTPLDIR